MITTFNPLCAFAAAGVLLAACARPPAPIAPGTAVIPNETRQLVVVVTPAWDSIRGELHRFERAAGGAWRRAGAPVRVVLGRTGLAWGLGFESWAGAGARQAPVKREGDGRSPAGVYGFAQAFGFAPADSTGLRLPYLPLTERTECVDDSASAHYNAVLERAAVVVDWKSSERMRSIAQYRRGAIVAYNPPPAARSRGSCIFLHSWRTADSPTAGCTALEAGQLEDVLRWLDPAHRPRLVQLPAGAYAELRERWGLPPL